MLYQSEADTAREQAFMRYAVERWSLDSINKLAHSLEIDFFAVKRGKVAYVEYKRRFRKFADFPDVFISAAKFLTGVSYARETTAKFIFCVECDDGLYRYVYRDGDMFPMKWGGRNDRPDDPRSREPVVLIPADRFDKF